MTSHNWTFLASTHPTCTEALECTEVPLRPSGPGRPALEWHRAPDCTRSRPPRLSHPLINSTQHHFLHSLTVPSLCVCVCEPASKGQAHPPMPEMAEVGEEHIREHTAAGLKAAALWSPPGGSHQPQPLFFALLCGPWLAWGRLRSGGVGEDWCWVIQPQGSDRMKMLWKLWPFQRIIEFLI